MIEEQVTLSVHTTKVDVADHSSLVDTGFEYVRCNLCGADNVRLRVSSTLKSGEPNDWQVYACTCGGYGTHGPIMQCQQCGLVYATPRRREQDVLELYETVEDALYIEEREGRILTFNTHLRKLESFTGAPNHRALLDVGAYLGVFVDVATRHGWDAWGVEPSKWAVTQARAQGLQMHLGTLEQTKLPANSFSVVTMWDVIEHLPNPLRTLHEAARVLEPQGWLVVHTMDIESVFARLMGKRWPWLMEMHLYYFSRRTLTAMLEKAGFEVAWVGTQGRYLRAGYLASRVTALIPTIGRPLEHLITALKLRKVPVRVNLGDLFTVYARKR
ncbi:MAG: class I SAM-dependent methyltransferase [Anaerolineae bacterium]|nr:class I SAM-dependent methyltransferase [Anaerolineae bacterium]